MLQIKLDNLFEIFKPETNLAKECFLLLKDWEGWSNGFIADLTNLNVETMKAKATLAQPSRFNDNKENCPEIGKLIPDGRHLVENIEYDLENKAVKLINHTVTVFVNPRYLAYFQKAYHALGGIKKLVLTGENKAVKVIGMDDRLIGLIMPIRAH